MDYRRSVSLKRAGRPKNNPEPVVTEPDTRATLADGRDYNSLSITRWRGLIDEYSRPLRSQIARTGAIFAAVVMSPRICIDSGALGAISTLCV